MEMDILKHLELCESILHKIYDLPKSGSLLILNEFCAEFSKCCIKLHKIIIEIMFLCLYQIISCVNYLEKTIKMERISNSILSLTRKFFVDRILWCFVKMKSLTNSMNDNTFPKILDETSFIVLIDTALELLVPYSKYGEENCDESTPREKFQTKIACQQLRTAIDKLIGQSLAFANVAQSCDKKVINSLCQKVLKDCIDFQNECDFSSTEKQLLTQKNIRLKSLVVENAIYKLEDFINESLLKLFFFVFTDLENNSVRNIRKSIKENPKDKKIDDMIADFDINVDRLIQIGTFALTFAPNSKVKTNVRNSLASLESLDSYLVPSLYSKCDFNFAILEEHFLEEVEKLKKSLQTIVETDALTESYLNILSEILEKNQFDLKDFTNITQMANLLIEHIELNESELKLEDDHEKNEKYNKFKLMANECSAILTCADQVEPKRILKRFKIMKSCLEKFKIILNKGSDISTKSKYEQIFITSEELAESQKMFESLGISPTIKSILYKNKKLNMTESLIGQCSRQLSFDSSYSETTIKTPEMKKLKRKISLRTAMFKRQTSEETKKMHKIFDENSMNLEISDILDQITGLSSSFG
ncbi:serendipity locus protein alpha [Condylostylus longicornis]|uniref:serendipity locus protein alpha n=1 Tax=Condylostylus longicornis TaxID=2530218 RepID=UPI00244E0DCE|nr:serendipity locus protein alpha [Condylostylus longicornis]